MSCGSGVRASLGLVLTSDPENVRAAPTLHRGKKEKSEINLTHPGRSWPALPPPSTCCHVSARRRSGRAKRGRTPHPSAPPPLLRCAALDASSTEPRASAGSGWFFFFLACFGTPVPPSRSSGGTQSVAQRERCGVRLQPVRRGASGTERSSVGHKQHAGVGRSRQGSGERRESARREEFY